MRVAAGLTQNAVADRAGLRSGAYYSEIECWARVPTGPELRTVLEVIGRPGEYDRLAGLGNTLKANGRARRPPQPPADRPVPATAALLLDAVKARIAAGTITDGQAARCLAELDRPDRWLATRQLTAVEDRGPGDDSHCVAPELAATIMAEDVVFGLPDQLG
jgi:transcriptional regulator with XRE-family HTH domain